MDAVVGFSYGTVLAQQYTAKNPEHVAKLVLASPLSRHQFKKQVDDPERKTFMSNLAGAYGELLENIFKRDTFAENGVQTNMFKKMFPKFFELSQGRDYNRDQIIKDITTEVTEIFITQEGVLLSGNPLIDFYDDLNAQAKQAKEQDLTGFLKLTRYDREFFVDLKDLRKRGGERRFTRLTTLESLLVLFGLRRRFSSGAEKISM